MFCWKCGKEIEENSKFCPYCGCNMATEQSDISDSMRQKELPPKKNINPKKLVILIVACITVIGAVIFVGVKVLQKPEEMPKQEAVESREEVAEPIEGEKLEPIEGEKLEPIEETVQDEEIKQYDTVITLAQSVKEQLELFVKLLGWCDHFANMLEDGKSIMEFSDSDMGYDFLYYSIYFDRNDKVFYNYPYDIMPPKFIIAEETAKKYLLDSLGRNDTSRFVIEGDNIIIDMWDVGSSGVERVEITNTKQVAENEIQIEGMVVFFEEWLISRTARFSITMTANPESIWGGYTLKSINSWKENDDFILPDITTRYYTEEELSSMDAHTLYLARNELYARYRYTFTSQDLQEYFGGKLWYIPEVTEVSDTLFTEYEKANLELIQRLEAKFN